MNVADVRGLFASLLVAVAMCVPFLMLWNWASVWWAAPSVGLVVLSLGSWVLWRRVAGRVRAWQLVRDTVVRAYDSGGDMVGLAVLAEILQDDRVMEARSLAHERDEEIWEARYARGEASDY